MQKILLSLGLTLALTLSLSAEAHRGWLLPSSTVLSGNDAWVGVDAAVSTDVFYADHNPLRLDALRITAPSGAELKPENLATGKFRTTFDVHLPEAGTYRIANVSDGLFANYKEAGQNKRWRGTAETFAKEVPANAEELKVSQAQSRLETFVTVGKPSVQALPAGERGLQLVPVTHPNDLFAGEEAKFRILLDGAPAAGLEIKIIPGGIRYREQLSDLTLVTDKDGVFTVRWPAAGMYWLSASYRDDKATAPATERRASYAATLEVLSQ